jgi:hypothetical protein
MIVSGTERSIVSGAERLRLGRSSDSNAAGRKLVETAFRRRLQRERKILDSGTWVDLANASGLAPGIFTSN